MNYQLLLSTATEIGTQLLINGAETYRVEDSVSYVLAAYQIKDFNVFAIPTCIIVSLTTDKGESLTKSKRISSRVQNIDRIVQINDLCRNIAATQPSLELVSERLSAIFEAKQYSYRARFFAYIMAGMSFTIFYGGKFPDAIVGGIIGGVIMVTSYTMKRFRMNAFTNTSVNSFIIALLAILMTRYVMGEYYDRIIIGCFMMLVPGVAITNAARDFIAGDLLSGTMRLSEAFLVATSIALGSGIALSIFR